MIRNLIQRGKQLGGLLLLAALAGNVAMAQTKGALTPNKQVERVVEAGKSTSENTTGTAVRTRAQVEEVKAKPNGDQPVVRKRAEATETLAKPKNPAATGDKSKGGEQLKAPRNESKKLADPVRAEIETVRRVADAPERLADEKQGAERRVRSAGEAPVGGEKAILEDRELRVIREAQMAPAKTRVERVGDAPASSHTEKKQKEEKKGKTNTKAGLKADCAGCNRQ